MSNNVNVPVFKYHDTNIANLKAKGTFAATGKMTVDSIELENGIIAKPSQRFWDSICSKFGFGPSIFRYFSHKEVFDRVSTTKTKDGEVRLTIQNTPSDDENPQNFTPILLGVSNPDKPLLNAAQVVQTLVEINTKRVEYREGVIVSRHAPRSFMEFDVSGDKHETRLTLETPIDGYGKPSVFMSLLRQKCQNGLVAYTKAFQSQVNIGNDDSAIHTLKRVVEAYNNEDGFVALRQRMASSAESWASINETLKLAKMFWKTQNTDFRPEFIQAVYDKPVETMEKDQARSDILSKLYEKAGDLRAIYGVAQIDSISKKKMRTLPTKAKVYDLLVFATEAATHWLRPNVARKFQGYCGELVSQEYDMEASCQEFGEFADFNHSCTEKIKQDEDNMGVDQ